MNQLASRQNNIPQNIEVLSKFVLVGREKLTAVRAEIRAIDKLGLADSVRRQKLEEAQLISEAVLDAEIRIGTLTAVIPKATNKGANQYRGAKTTAVSQKQKSETIKELGFSSKQVERFEKLAKNPEIVEQAKTEARENDDIVSRSFVLEKIKTADILKRREEIKKVKPKELTGEYDVIYCDPPWYYDVSTSESRKTENHYPTMTIEEIKSLHIPAADNSVILMWTTAPMLEKALDVLREWEFNYRTCAVWDKEIFGMGHWFRVQHEILLIGTKGNFKTPLPENRVSSVYREKRTVHSKKPDYYHALIEKMFPNVRYLELFARQKYSDKWDTWGNHPV
jgi:N6-adenosine-specific RNA methylase IME4